MQIAASSSEWASVLQQDESLRLWPILCSVRSGGYFVAMMLNFQACKPTTLQQAGGGRATSKAISTATQARHRQEWGVASTGSQFSQELVPFPKSSLPLTLDLGAGREESHISIGPCGYI